VRGALFQRDDDSRNDTFGVRKHLIAPEPDDPIALELEPGCAPLVVVHFGSMLAAIEFDDEMTIRRNLTPSIWRFRK
jgi:hypothetical protein